MSFKQLAWFALVAFFSPVSLPAQTIVVGFEGYVLYTDDDCWCIEDVHVGDPITGYYVYALGALDIDPSPKAGRYEYDAGPTEIVVSVGSYWARSRYDNVDIALTMVDSFALDVVPKDYYAIFSSSNTDFKPYLYTTQISVRLQDLTLTAVTSDALPTEVPNLDDWSYASVWIQGSQPWLVVANITSIFAGIPTGIPDRTPTPLILNNYPNPFSESTVFSVETGLPSALLNVYDVRGRRVRSLAVPGSTEGAGASVSWDGIDDAGALLPSGVYLARITTPLGLVTRKVTILR